MKKAVTIIKSIILTALVAFIINGKAQNTCDTSKAPSIASGCAPNSFVVIGGGYVSGNNSYGDLEKAQKFRGVGGNLKIVSSILILANNKTGTTGLTKMKIYSVNPLTGGPQNLLATSFPVSLNNVDTSGGLTQYTFPNPVIVPDDFFASLVLPTTTGDTIAVATTDFSSCLTNDTLAWEMWSDGTWYSFWDISGWGFNLDLFIFPIVCDPSSVYYFSGNVFDDVNNDNIRNNGESGIGNVLIKTEKDNFVFNTDAAGNYSAYSPYSADTLTILPPIYSVANPVQYAVNAGDTGKNFAVHYLVNVKDLQITVTNLTPARPGFDDVIMINYRNIGNTTMSGTVTLDFNDTNLTFLSSNPAQSGINGNTISWNYTNLIQSEQRSIIATFNVNTTTPLNTLLLFHGIIYPVAGDTVPFNNYDGIEQVVTGSFDPNDKEVIPDNGLTPQQLSNGEKLIYTIHFQNTGTDTAFNIKVIDTLSSFLDASTFQLLSSSHPCTFNLKGAGIVEFVFKNILLPDSNKNFVGSNGFVKFAIKPIPGLVLGDVVTNTAFIYFDFNQPVMTNTVSTTIAERNGIIGYFTEAGNINLYPNPASSAISVELGDVSNGGLCKVYDILGEEIISKTFTGNKFSIDVSGLAKGLYLLKVENENGVEVRRFIKE